jgi:hypothetical protein
MADLRNQQLKDRYQTLLTLSDTGTDPATGTLQNGKGTPITGLTLNSLGLNTTQGISRLQVNNIGSDTSFFDVVGGDAIIAGNSVTVSKTQRGILHIENNQRNVLGRNASLTFGLGGSQFIDTYYVVGGAIRTEITGTANLAINPKMVFSVLDGASTTGTLTDYLEISHTGAVTVGGTLSAGKLVPTANTVAGNGMYLPAANTLALSTNGVERLRIDSSGNVGIGTSSTDDYVLNLQRPSVNNSFTILNIQSSWLNSATDKGATRLQFQAKDADVNASAPTTIATIDALTPNNWTSEADARGYLRFNTLNDGTLTEAMRINSSQNVRIGSSGALVSGLLVSRATGSADPIPVEMRLQSTTNANDCSTTDPWARLSFYSSDSSGGGPKIHASIDAVMRQVQGTASILKFNVSNINNATLSTALEIFDNTGSNPMAVYPGTDNAQQLGLSNRRWGTIHTGSITIGTGENNRATIAYTTNAARTYTIPNAGANADFIMSEGTQTINGPKTFGSVTRIPSGINFNASGGSTLSHYEVGTFNADAPALTVNYTFTKKEGRYTRIGDTVTVYFDYRWTSTNAGAGDTEFTGLPFTAAKDATVNFILMNGVIDTVQVWGRVLEGTSKFNIRGRTRNESTIYGPAPKTIWNASGATNILSGYITYHI